MSELTQSRIDELADRAAPFASAIIDGQAARAASGRTFDALSAIDGSTLASLPACDASDVDRAVAAARAAYERRSWVRLNSRDRKRILRNWADLIAREAMELAVLETRDMGMPIGLTRNFEIPNAIDTLYWYSECTDKLYDELIALNENTTAQIVRMPLGVVGVVLPWNAPAMIGAWKLGPALVAGNSIVLKPSEEASLVLLRMAELALEAGLPKGVLEVVTGGGEVGHAIASHRDVDCITFTGSTRTGGAVMEAAAKSNLKRVSLELGGKSANIVFADAADLDFAADVSVGFMFGNQGQVCEAPTRLLVQRAVYDAFVDKIVARARGLRVGDPLKLETDLGPIVNQRQYRHIMACIDRGLADGARLAIDGRSATGGVAGGSYMGASVAVDVTPHSYLAQEEIFGPVLSILPFETEEEAVNIANATRFGLGANIWSSNINTVTRVARRLVAGNINVNGGAGPVVELPFGGFKQSGFGRDRSLHAIDKYSDLKNIIIQTPPT